MCADVVADSLAVGAECEDGEGTFVVLTLVLHARCVTEQGLSLSWEVRGIRLLRRFTVNIFTVAECPVNSYAVYQQQDADYKPDNLA